MKYKRLVLGLSAFIIFFTYIVIPYVETSGIDTDGFKENIIRFHIRANSDLKDDQDLKLKIRDEILEAMNKRFELVDSIEKCREIIVDNLDEMKRISEDVISREGKDYQIEVSLGQDSFPTRKYGNMIFPQGEYETLLIEIGEAKGQNWWCVMFPPLCFVDITHSVAIDTDEVDLDSLSEYVIDETQPIKFKSIIADFVKKIF